MSEGSWRRHLRQSVFAKLVAIMLAMAASLLVLVTALFMLYLGPLMNASIDGVVHEYVHAVAATAPDYETAREIGARLDIEMRYEGPDGAWTTAEDLPTIAEVERQRRGLLSGRHYYVAAAPDGGKYLVAWELTERMRTAHLLVPAVMLLLMGVVVFAAHGFLRRLLSPLRWLGEGVAALSAGHLDVVVPKRSADEFGALTDAFNRMVGRVKDMIQTRDRLLLDVSHELRSPLTRLKVALELVADPNMKARMATDIAEMEIMIAELLELERLRDGHGISTTRQNLVVLVSEVARSYEERPPGVRLSAPASEIPVDIDADRMRTVIRNLLENAVKYSSPTSRPVEISVSQDADTVMVRVTDDGVGIPEGDVERVFEPFFRVDRSRAKSTGGYGLGLSICKRVMQAHGGDIAVERQSGRGTAFVLTLPKAASRGQVPWKRNGLHKSRSAAPGWQGAKSEHIGHM